MNKHIQNAVVLSLLAASSSAAFSQQCVNLPSDHPCYCTTVAGTWHDSLGTWTLTQSQGGGILGSMTPTSFTCHPPYNYDVSGNFTTNGQFTIQATWNHTPVAGCHSPIVLNGTIPLGSLACMNANISATGCNPSCNDPLFANNCAVPGVPVPGEHGETASTFDSWENGFPGLALFNEYLVPLQNNSYYNWSGRRVTENFSNSSNTCIPAWTQGPHLGLWYIGADNADRWDEIGFQIPDPVNSIRQQHSTPCALSETQTMAIDCPNPTTGQLMYVPFEAHNLSIFVYPNTVKMYRNGAPSPEQNFGIPQYLFVWPPVEYELLE